MSPGAEAVGLGLLDLTTSFGHEKVLRVDERAGYEIHHGRVRGETRSGAVSGTMVHGSLEDDSTRAAYLLEELGVTSRASFATPANVASTCSPTWSSSTSTSTRCSTSLSPESPTSLPVLPPGDRRSAAH